MAIDEKVLIERLEEEKSDWNYDYNVTINKAIEIVKDLAESYHIHCEQQYMKGYEDGLESVRSMLPYEEHNNGWIPCEVRLPKEKGDYLVTCNDGKVCVWWFVVDGDFKRWLIGVNNLKPIAWQPLPAPYKKGE